VNEKNETLYLCNGGLSGFQLHPGKNFVTLEFKDDNILLAFYINLIVLAIFGIFCCQKLILYLLIKNR
jgi:hypothetical protein